MAAQIESEAAGTADLRGVNGAGFEAGNATMTDGRTIPLLQDDSTTNAWGLWAVTYRDVVVLDPANEVFAVYNLTTHDLADPANYATLKALIQDATSP
jgi:hypothetical protein